MEHLWKRQRNGEKSEMLRPRSVVKDWAIDSSCLWTCSASAEEKTDNKERWKASLLSNTVFWDVGDEWLIFGVHPWNYARSSMEISKQKRGRKWVRDQLSLYEVVGDLYYIQLNVRKMESVEILQATAYVLFRNSIWNWELVAVKVKPWYHVNIS